MKHIAFLFTLTLFFLFPVMALAQVDTTGPKKDTTAQNDTTAKTIVKDTTVVAKTDSVAPAPNCYQEWSDIFTAQGAKPVTDGMQEVVIAFKNADTYHCFMGRVEVIANKIKPPLYVQTEAGDYKTFNSMGKKLDPEFIAAAGDQLYKITDGMSALFKTADGAYGKIFFYKFLARGKQANKKAPSPSELLKE